MSKRGKRARDLRRLKWQKQRQRNRRNKVRRLFGLIFSPVGPIFWLLALMTIATTYFSFQSSVSVEIERPLDPQHPFPAIFKITNEGWLPIYHVRRMVGVSKVENIYGGRIEGMQFDDSAPEIPNLDAKETATVTVRMPFYRNEMQYRLGDINVNVYYSTFIRTKKMQGFRFTLAYQADGTARWLHRARSE